MANVYKKIFAALDGSEMQLEVARKAMMLAADNEAELCFGHVVDAVPVEATGIDMGELCREVQERFENQLADVLEELRRVRLEPKRLRFVHHTAAAPPSLFLLEARLGGGVGLTVEPPLLLHGPDGGETEDVRRAYFR